MSFRVVIDPNVLVSASLVAVGPSARIVEAWHDGAFELIVCPSLVDELRDVLSRKRLAVRVTARERALLLQMLSEEATNLDDPEVTQGLTGDPDDDYLASLTLASGAVYLVTGDRVLTTWEHEGILVVTPRAFLEIINPGG